MATLLLVDDNPLNSDVVSRRLQRRGYQVLTAADGLRAVELAHTAAPAMILMDVSLPGLDGWEATRQLKQHPATRHIPILALAARAASGDREKALAAGYDDYESKPIEFRRLLAKIQSYVAPQPPPAEQPRPVLVPSPAPLARLLVGDAPELNGSHLAAQLRAQGFEVWLAASGREVLELTRRQKFDLVLLDAHTPGLDGFDVLRLLRSCYSRARLPVILVAPCGDDDDITRALEVGANDCTTRPINYCLLLAHLQAHLLLRQAQLRTPTRQPEVTNGFLYVTDEVEEMEVVATVTADRRAELSSRQPDSTWEMPLRRLPRLHREDQ